MRRAIYQVALAFVLIVLFSTFSYAQKLSADEQRIIAYINAHMGEAIGMVENVVKIESPSEDLAGVNQAARGSKQELESLGLTARWITMPAERKPARHLVA